MLSILGNQYKTYAGKKLNMQIKHSIGYEFATPNDYEFVAFTTTSKTLQNHRLITASAIHLISIQ